MRFQTDISVDKWYFLTFCRFAISIVYHIYTMLGRIEFMILYIMPGLKNISISRLVIVVVQIKLIFIKL